MAKRKKDRWDGTERRAPAMVLIVGEDSGANELLVRVLGSHGYRTVVATSIDTATARATDQLPRVAVIDLSSGGISASLQLLDWFRSNDDPRISRTRVIVVARSASNRNFSFQSGADDYLQRPFHADDLVASIEGALAVPHADLPVRRRRLMDGTAPQA
ncbi:response regulator [Actinospongicola halichondriae]|uniref:response regulator n=1 Tax=Actinospongicola halichondriae TaxID=3236844 RepID=UPI003D455B8B